MVLTDTGFWLALISKRDRHHDRAVAFTAACREPLVTTWPVITEASYLFSTDQRDFDTYCWKNHQPFENLLLP